MSAFDDFLADVNAARQWLLELDVLSLAPISDGTQATGAYDEAAYSEVAYGEGDGNESGGLATLYYSSHGLISRSTDTPANTWYDSRLTGDINVSRLIYGENGVAGLAQVFAEAQLRNDDGTLDGLLDSYALDGRAARILIGRPADARADYGLVFSGIVRTATVGLRTFHLQLSDGLARLDVPLNTTNYAGTGGLEGGADLKGKPKPKCYGNAKNVSPPLVDSVNLIYQVNDGLINAVPNVYDRGIALAEVGGAPGAGQYQVNTAAGTFKLGATPAGTVTADVLGDASGGYVNKTADIVQRILLNQVSMDSSEIDAAAIAALNVDAPAEVGSWTGTDVRTAREAIEELLRSAGSFGGFSRIGKYTVGQVKAASGAAAASYSGQEIGNIAREPLPLGPLIWRASVAWQRNYTVQTDLAAAVTAARRTFAAQPQRVASRENLPAKSQRPLAVAYGPTEDLYALEADAGTEAQRRLDLWSATRKFYRVPLPAIALQRELGDVVNLKHPRHNLSAGADGRVLAYTLRGTNVELMVLI